MNDAINYSHFIDIALDSSEEFEPYGYSSYKEIIEKRRKRTEKNKPLPRKPVFRV